MRQYLSLMKDILSTGEITKNRTGIDTLSVFGRQMRFDLRKGFPIVTVKKTSFHIVKHELLWMLSGDTNIKYLNANGISIWDEWADKEGDLGPIYGAQWRSWRGYGDQIIDQIATLMRCLKNNPTSRRHIITAWNPAELGSMALAPCHVMAQFNVSGGNNLSCMVTQRSADVFLGVPYNISFYALLTELIANQLGFVASTLVWSGGDCHIYTNHIEQAKMALKRTPYRSPRLVIDGYANSIFEYKASDIKLDGYRHHAAIPAPVAV